MCVCVFISVHLIKEQKNNIILKWDPLVLKVHNSSLGLTIYLRGILKCNINQTSNALSGTPFSHAKFELSSPKGLKRSIFSVLY